MGFEEDQITLYVASIIDKAKNNDQELEALLDEMIPLPLMNES